MHIVAHTLLLHMGERCVRHNAAYFFIHTQYFFVFFFLFPKPFFFKPLRFFFLSALPFFLYVRASYSCLLAPSFRILSGELCHAPASVFHTVNQRAFRKEYNAD